MTRRLRGVLTGLLLLPAPLAAAEEALGVLAVAEPPGPDAGLARLAGELRAALAARAAGVLDDAALRERMASRPPPAALAALDRAYAGALAAHAAGEFEGAHQTLRAVVEALEALPEGPQVFSAWTRAMFRLARSEQELGRGVDAQAVLDRLLRAAPEARAELRQYPPSFLNLIEDGRSRLRALGTRRLTVEAQPGARVFVEGREVGSSPVAVELAPGRYRVVGLVGGVASASVVVDLVEDRAVQLDTSLAEALRPEAGPGLALPISDRAPRLRAAGSRLALDRLVSVALRTEGDEARLVATLHELRGGAPDREAWILLARGAPPPRGLEDLAGYLIDGRGSALVATPLGPSLSLQVSPPERLAGLALQGPAPSRRSSALGWAAVGAGVATIAAGGLAAIYGREAEARYGEARGMVDKSGRVAPPHTVSEYNAAIRAGDARRTKAIALGVGAGVGAATTALLWYWSWRRTGELGPVRF